MNALPGTTGRRRIYLMRHGHVDYLHPRVAETGDTKSVPLTRLGREQATASGQALAHVRFDIAISSGYPRTRETLDLVLARNEHEVPPHEHEPDLVELHGGRMQALRSRRELAAAMTFPFDAAAQPGARVQSERQGHFVVDRDPRQAPLIFNRTVGLRDTWASQSP